MMYDGFILMFIGMAVVFAFLLIIFLAVQISGLVIKRLTPAVAVAAGQFQASDLPAAYETRVANDVIPAISAAVAYYRKKYK